MKLLKKGDMLALLETLNDKLNRIHQHGELIIVGGAAMALVYNVRPSTYDIDAIFEPKVFIQKAISDIAEELDIQDDWLNDGAKGFFTPSMKVKPFKKYSNLTVNCLDPMSLLAMKLSSARTEGKDFKDSVALCGLADIKFKEQLFDILQEHIPKERLTINVKYFTESVFEEYAQQVLQNSPATKAVQQSDDEPERD